MTRRLGALPYLRPRDDASPSLLELEEAWPPSQREAPCCRRTLDEHGRYCIGFCGPGCLRRPAVWRAHVRARRRARVVALPPTTT